MASIIINGNSFSGSNITIRNGNVIVDGVDMTPDDKKISISVTGDVESLDVGHCTTLAITGNVRSVRSGSGDVEVGGNCNGAISTGSGDVEVGGYCDGDINTGSGDVLCGEVKGSVKTMSGDIKHRKG